MCVRRSGRDSGCCKRPHFSRPSFPQHSRARLHRRSRRTDVVHQNDAEIVDAVAGADHEGVADVGGSGACRQAGLGARPPPSPQDGGDRQPKADGQLVRLVEPAPPMSQPVQRNRDDQIGAAQDGVAVTTEERAERAGDRSPAIVLERVHDRPEGSIVVADRTPCRDVRAADPARVTSVARTFRAPRPKGIAADAAEGWTQQPDPAPAGVADHRVQGRFQWLRTGGAWRRQQNGEDTVGCLPNCSLHDAGAKAPATKMQGRPSPLGVQVECQSRTCAEVQQNLGLKRPRAQKYELSAGCHRGTCGYFCDRRQDAGSPGGVSVISIRSASPHSRSSE
jgi:hypothetical protein